jgi:phosphate-selective porin OprO/OprP
MIISNLLFKKRFFVTIVFITIGFSSQAQSINQQIPYFTYGKGLGIISPDSMYLMNIRFRMQNRVGIVTASGSDWQVSEIEARIRRLRLRFDGFIYNPKLTYLIQLAFSRGDMDYDDTGFPNIIRDAMVIYNFNKHFALGLGQTKLPGNRQRVTSSGDLQLPDRSIVSTQFNVDRDFGLQLYYRNRIKGFNYLLRGAISSGEGRNFNSASNGLAYTGRVELLPFGEFTNNGDYFEGDLVREPKPKLSIAGGYSNNENTLRSGGQLGKFLYQPRDIETTILDGLFKHNGWAIATEFLIRKSPGNPITLDTAANERHVFIGHGQNYQGSYLLRNNFEFVLRYSHVSPERILQTNLETTEREGERTQYTIGVNKYLKGHRVKLQTEFTYGEDTWPLPENPNADYFLFRFQIEVGI